ITRDASFRAREAFISPSAAITYSYCVVCVMLHVLTLALASRVASASAAMLSVASSRLVWKTQEKETLCCSLYKPYLLWRDVE
uniref:Uncharacterized protein n=1 Tax=Mastacembelus armatus TaxID=205130 RepID=A0A3Q3MZT6_9TELE